jgi:galactokinase/mevalonate kinase-like predicted kinase
VIECITCWQYGALERKYQAGGGGLLLVYCERQTRQFKRKLMNNTENFFLLEKYGSKIIFD